MVGEATDGSMTAAGATSKGSILVVDDNRLVLATLSDGLTRAGYHVYDADNGDDAILLARAHRPDLALLDIRMEGKSGFDVAQYLRTQCQMPFMFLSAFSDEQTVAQVKALGAVAYLVKPLDIKQIVPAVEAAFAHLEARVGAATAGRGRAAAGAAAGIDIDTLDPTTAMAVGVLMHRYSLTRGEATERLLRQAAAEKQSPRAAAELLLAAVEQLAGPARH
jgi:two-component system, response regulator PdtaR